MTIYDFNVLNQNGEEVSLEKYRGKVLLVVNTATKCGFTPQYEALEKIYEELNEKGFEILDFPCDQFFHQAPGSDEEINKVCKLKYNTKFTRFKKVEVKGDKAIPLYKWLITQNDSKKPVSIKWNFTKFLIDRDGNVLERYSPMTKPEKFLDRIKEELNK
ncbi:MAG: glutathione peroxidase [Acholeplasmatales bacterium]|nr:glutathione peroxidase [Acholeplasmatales bacterium]